MFLSAFLLGLVEGLTEFIPVSSTGHMILVGDLLHFQGPTGDLFEIVIQLGAILAVCWLYREQLFTTTQGMIRREEKDWRFATGIVAAFLPAMIFGVIFHDFIKKVLFSPMVVSVALVAGGLLILLVG